MSNKVNVSERPDLLKDAKDFVKTKENLINNKDSEITEDDPIAAEMKKGAKKPDKDSIKNSGAKEGFSNKEGFFSGSAGKAPKGKQRAWKPIVDFTIALFIVPFILYYSISFLSILRGYKIDRMVPGLDPERSPYTNIGAKPDDLAFEESIFSMKRHGFPYSFHDKEYPNSLFSIFARFNKNAWLLARDCTDKALEIARNFTTYEPARNYTDQEKDFWFNAQEFLNIFAWTPIVATTVFLFGIIVGPLMVSLKSWYNTTMR